MSKGRNIEQIDLANWEIFLWSLYQVGGDKGMVDVELAFIKAHQLAPGRFSWRTRDDLPEIKSLLSWRRNLFIHFDGELDSDEFKNALMETHPGGTRPLTKRFFCDDVELFHNNDKTYSLTNQWGRQTMKAANAIKVKYPQLEISVSPVGWLSGNWNNKLVKSTEDA